MQIPPYSFQAFWQKEKCPVLNLNPKEQRVFLLTVPLKDGKIARKYLNCFSIQIRENISLYTITKALNCNSKKQRIKLHVGVKINSFFLFAGTIILQIVDIFVRVSLPLNSYFAPKI